MNRFDVNIGCGGFILRFFLGASIFVLVLGAVIIGILAIFLG